MKYITLILFPIIFFAACSGDGPTEKQLKNKLQRIIKDGQYSSDDTISESEFKNILSRIRDANDYDKFVDKEIVNVLQQLSDDKNWVLEKISTNSIISQPNIINIYMEVSASMKGYIIADETNADYTIKEVVPKLITDCSNNYDSIRLFTITDQPKEFKKTENDFIEALIRGKIFRNASTSLDKIFEHITKNTPKGEMSILISDCILDFKGKVNNAADKGILTTAITSSLSNQKDLTAAVFQFYSDFNGQFYYTTENKQPFSKGYARPNGTPNKSHTLLHERPFYIWVFGEEAHVKDFVIDEIVDESIHSHSYGLNYLETEYSIIDKLFEGRVSTSPKAVTINGKINENRPTRFTVGMNVSSLPKYAQTKDYIKNKLQSNIDYIDYELEVYDKEEIKALFEDKKFRQVASQIGKRGYNRFLVIKLNNTPADRKNKWKLSLTGEEPSWIKNTNIDDDREVSASSLEKRTFLFTSITNAFNDRYEDQNTLFELSFDLNIR